MTAPSRTPAELTIAPLDPGNTVRIFGVRGTVMLIARRIHVITCWVFIVALAAQVLLAGIGVMGGDLDLHIELGALVLHLLIPAMLLATAALGRMGWQQAGWSFLLFVLITFQIAMVGIGDQLGSNLVQGLHPLLAVLSWPLVYFLILQPAQQMEHEAVEFRAQHGSRGLPSV
ncbi:MAG: hypothetical protein ABI200_02895 [Gaiellales bacterium]